MVLSRQFRTPSGKCLPIWGRMVPGTPPLVSRLSRSLQTCDTVMSRDREGAVGQFPIPSREGPTQGVWHNRTPGGSGWTLPPFMPG
jgi:hypothetical protein